MTNIIDGRAYANILKRKIAEEVAFFQTEHNYTPKLIALCVGDDPASQVYLAAKSKQAKDVGMQAEVRKYPKDITPERLEEEIDQLNQDPTVSGILLQLPLPEGFQASRYINCIDPQRDVDGLTLVNAGALTNGQPLLVPCTPLGCLLLLRKHIDDLSGQHAVIVGRSPLVGKPIAQMLLAENCTVTITHSKTRNLPDICKQADILIAAVGRAHFIKKDWVKPETVVLDVGINRLSDGTLTGDVDFEALKDSVTAITPVPGGIGPMTVACLLLNTVLAAARQHHFQPSIVPLQPLENHWCPF